MSKKKPKKKGFMDRIKESAAQQQLAADRSKSAKQKKPIVETPTAPPVETTPEEKKKKYQEGIIKTVVPAFIGTLAGFICFYGLDSGTGVPWISIMLFVIIFSYYAQRVLYPIIRINVKELGVKDWFYVEFITVDFWLVVWTLLLN